MAKSATTRRRAPATRIVTGDSEIDALLTTVQKIGVANKIARSGLVPAVRVMVKAIKAQVPGHLKSVRKSIGGNVKADRRTKVVRARAGAAVGVKTKTDTGNGKQRGVGMSAANIHWYVLGTTQRTTKSGHSTGAMPANPIVKDGATAAVPEAQRVLKQKCREAFEREMRKVGAK